MKIPAGVTFSVGRKTYREGDELPPNAPENIKKLCAEKEAEAKKGKAPEKPPAPASAQPRGEDGK